MQGDGGVRLVEYGHGCVVANFSKGVIGSFKWKIAQMCCFGLDKSVRGTRVQVKGHWMPDKGAVIHHHADRDGVDSREGG